LELIASIERLQGNHQSAIEYTTTAVDIHKKSGDSLRIYIKAFTTNIDKVYASNTVCCEIIFNDSYTEKQTEGCQCRGDGTGRLQTVFREESPRYYRLIERFAQATGVPVVLNTSFNLRGEPIVNTPANAFSTFSNSEMDNLVMENFMVDKTSVKTTSP
jgi:carbamoyltransferase